MRLLIIFLLLIPWSVTAQIDNSGPGRAIYFDGNSPTNVDLGDSYNSLSFPFSISMWVRLDEDKNTIAALFASEEGSFLYRGFWVRITKTNLGLGWGDGTGGNFEAYRRVKVADVADISGKWVHLAFVALADDNIEIYLNGILQSGYWTGSSSLSMENHVGDKVSVGQMFTNGQTWRMKGYIDEVRLWERIRTENEIRRDMCRKISGDQDGLIGYWSFDETAGSATIDKSVSGIDGSRIAANTYPYSGAPIGDTSIYIYPATPNVKLTHDELSMEVSEISANALGYHIYLVESPDLEGISCQPGFYYGVYSFSNNVAEPDVKVQFSESFDSLIHRQNNFQRSWTTAELDDENKFSFLRRIELLPQGKVALDLGDNLQLCENQTYVIEGPSDPNIQLTWSDGSHGDSFLVDGQTQVWAMIEGICGISSDTVNITYTSSPDISLERDIFYCNELPIEVTIDSSPNTNILWSDGSEGNSYLLDELETISYEARNICGVIQGVIQVKGLDPFEQPPNIFTPNQDDFNTTFIISESLEGSELTVYNRWGNNVYYDPSYSNDWSGNGLGAGTYFYKLINPCLAEPIKGFVHILR